MIKISIDTSALVNKAIPELQRKVVRATAIALTKTAQQAQKGAISAMQQVFDRPTPYTLRGTRVKPAKYESLQASVEFKTDVSKGTQAEKYLGPEVFGGQIDGIPLVPARSEDVYAIYKRWADRNGHRYIHSKNQFITRAMRMPGMSKRERQLYMDGDNRKQASFLFPPGVDQGDKSHSAWLTDSAALFAECAKDWNRP